MGGKTGGDKSAAKKLGITVEEWQSRRTNGELWCYCCRQWKPVALFSLEKARSSGRASCCKPCVSHKATASRYQISVEEARQLRSNTRTCDICGRAQKLEVDHNHSTGAVRGVLCSRCNGALGQFCDDVSLLKLAIKYLEERDGTNEN